MTVDDLKYDLKEAFDPKNPYGRDHKTAMKQIVAPIVECLHSLEQRLNALDDGNSELLDEEERG